MRIDQLQYLVAIADAGSIMGAAEKLHISQPRISQFISQFEAEMDTQVFIRTRLGTQPTDTGKLIIEKAREIILQAMELKNFAHNSSQIVGKLTVATVPSMCTTILPKALSSFKTKFPKIQLELRELGGLEIREQLMRNEVDLAVSTFRHSSDSLETHAFKQLLKGHVMACVNSRSPLAGKKTISFNDIIAYPVVLVGQSFRMHDRILSSLKKIGEPNVLFTARNPSSVKAMVMEGLAIGFDANISLLVDPHVLSGDIIPIPIAEESTTAFGVWYKKRHKSIAAEQLIQELTSQAEHFSRIYKL